MIEFHGVQKSFRVQGGGRKYILRDFDLVVPPKRQIAVIGRNGMGKSSFLRLVAGTLRPDRGQIIRRGRISWPMGFAGGFHPQLTGRQNARFVARIYGVDTDTLVASVEDFCELGPYFDTPVITYSSGMRARLALGVSLAADFDCYLVDEITAVGDTVFKKKAQKAFSDLLGDVQMFFVSHSENSLREYCDAALFLKDGHGTYFDDLEDGLAAYKESIAS